MRPFLRTWVDWITYRSLSVSVLGNVVRNIHHLLFSGIQPQHLHGWMQIAWLYGRSPQSCLEGPEDGGDALQLPLCQHLPWEGHVVTDPQVLALTLTLLPVIFLLFRPNFLILEKYFIKKIGKIFHCKPELKPRILVVCRLSFSFRDQMSWNVEDE